MSRHAAPPYVIAIDFDGCLCRDKYPNIGKPNKYIIRKAIRRQAKGAKLILWTCREGWLLQQAIQWSAAHGLIFDFINQNHPEWVSLYGSDCRKIGANEYWDDKARRVK